MDRKTPLAFPFVLCSFIKNQLHRLKASLGNAGAMDQVCLTENDFQAMQEMARLPDIKARLSSGKHSANFATCWAVFGDRFMHLRNFIGGICYLIQL